MDKKFIFITGGVISGLGKGVITASLARLLKSRHYSVSIIKFDPYLNIDAGSMNPFQHGEVFVTSDGQECDMDMGTYERFLERSNNKHNFGKQVNITSGRIYDKILKKERRGEGEGKTIQIIPHVTDEIKNEILNTSSTEFTIIEIGGSVGDIESLPFFEAVRQLSSEKKNQCLNVHVSYIPYLSSSEEEKSKPTQNSIKELRSLGINADILMTRSSSQKLCQTTLDKLCQFCNLSEDKIIHVPDTNIYKVPQLLEQQHSIALIEDLLQYSVNSSGGNTQKVISNWENLLNNKKGKSIRIAIATKYYNKDAHCSLLHMIEHCCCNLGINFEIDWIECSEYDDQVNTKLRKADLVIIAGGFGIRGYEKKIKISEICKKVGIPQFGICLGFQTQIISALREDTTLNRAKLTSEEIEPYTTGAVISLLEDQKEVKDRGGTLKVGSQKLLLTNNDHSLTSDAYQEQKEIKERFRHRYEFNSNYITSLEDLGYTITLMDYSSSLVCGIELNSKKQGLVIGTQFHPEFSSTLTNPHPLFMKFLEFVIS